MYDIQNMGERIASLRKEKDLTQEAFAKLIGVSPQAVSKWETGNGYPDISLLPMISMALGISLDRLFGAAEPAPAQSDDTEGVFPAFYEGMKRIVVNDRVACYSDLEAASVSPLFVEFEGGSSANLVKGEVVNKGGGRILLLSEERILREQKEDEMIAAFGKAEDGSSAIDGKILKNREEGSDYYRGIHALCFKISGQADIELVRGHAKDDSVGWEASGSLAFMQNMQVERKGETLYFISKNHQSFFKTSLMGNHNSLRVSFPSELGSRLEVNLGGAGNMKSEISFEETSVHVSGSSDLQLADCGMLEVRISGAGDMYCRSFSSADMTISGNGDIEIEKAAGDFSAAVSGNGDIFVNGGEVNDLELRISGSGDFNAAKLTAQNARVTLSGACDVLIGCVKGESVERVNSFTSQLKILSRG